MTKGKFDLSALDTKKGAEQGYDLELTGPDGEGTGVFITLIGADCEEYQRALRKVNQRRANHFVKTRKFDQNPDQLLAEDVDLLLIATRGWRSVDEAGRAEPVVVVGEDTFTYSPDNVRKLYMRFPIIREQVAEAVNDRGNFLPKSANG